MTAREVATKVAGKPVEFDGSAIGEWTDPEHFEVTAERIAEYAAATNDPIAAHRNGEVAPPVFAIVPVFGSLAPSSLSVAPVELLPKLVHGEQDFVFHRAIRPGDALTVKARPIGYVGRENGSAVVVYAETRGADGELVNEQWMTAFFRGANAGGAEGEEAPTHRLEDSVAAGSPVATVTQHIDADQTFRYSPASGDPMPIHLDDEIAQMSGLPGIINHGLCTMAFTSWAALREFAGDDTSSLRRLAVRFAKPVLPDNDIVTSFWELRAPESDGKAVGFRSESLGEVVIRDGLAVFG